MNTGQDLPAGTATGRSPGRAAAQARRDLLGDIDQEGIADHLGVEHQRREGGGVGPQPLDQVVDRRRPASGWAAAARTGWADRRRGRSRPAARCPARCTLPVISRSLPFWTCRVLKRKRVAAALLLGRRAWRQAHLPRGGERDLGRDVALEMPAAAILGEIVHRRADARRVGRRAQPQRVFGAVRLHLGQAPARRGERAEQGGCKTKRTRRGIAAPCAPGGIGSIVRAMSLRDIVAAIRRRRREPPLSAPPEAQADLVEVFKGERRMELKRAGPRRSSVTEWLWASRPSATRSAKAMAARPRVPTRSMRAIPKRLSPGADRRARGDPSMSPFEFVCAGERLQALPAGALHWPARRLLAVADLHLEKGSSYAVNRPASSCRATTRGRRWRC